jgi:hypothetical protein
MAVEKGLRHGGFLVRVDPLHRRDLLERWAIGIQSRRLM